MNRLNCVVWVSLGLLCAAGVAVGQQPAPPAPQTIKVIQLTNCTAHSLATTLGELLGNVKIAVDSRLNAVILSGLEKDLEVAEAIAMRLDSQNTVRIALQPENSLERTVRVLWLVAGPSEMTERLAAPPKDLEVVIQELAKLGIEKPRLAAQTLVNTSSGGKLEIDSALELEFANRLSISGKLQDLGGNPSLQVQIGAQKDGARSSTKLCNLATQITTPLGHFVVLGVTPTHSLTSIFVVQVSASVPTKAPGAVNPPKR